MINFRYHIISLVAVFLALGLGVALGSAVIDTAVVRRLEQNINTLAAQKDELQRENGVFQEQVEAVERLGDEAGAELLGGHLDDVPVFTLAVRGVEEDPVERTAEAMTDAGSDFGGTLWLTERLALDDESERQDLARLLALEPALAHDPVALRDALLLRLGNALADALRAQDPLDPGNPDEFATEEPGVLTDLRTAGFVEFEPPAGEAGDDGIQLPVAGARMVAVSGPGAVVPDDDLLLPLLSRLAIAGPAPVVAAQAIDDDPPDGEEPSRTGFVGSVRDDDELRATVSTVDDLELFIGRVAAVLGLEQASDGLVGHYGIGSGADQVVPVRPEGE